MSYLREEGFLVSQSVCAEMHIHLQGLREGVPASPSRFRMHCILVHSFTDHFFTQ